MKINIIQATRDNNLRKIKKAIKCDPNRINECDMAGYSCLHVACRSPNQKKIIEYLIHVKGVNINQQAKNGNSNFLFLKILNFKFSYQLV